ncbi:MAG: type II CAAX endopeptidase family protein [Oscillospiraceae bacterium]|nr:type II CAAX endopeptidase family protein [Oscillospiraceae bacterium]
MFGDINYIEELKFSQKQEIKRYGILAGAGIIGFLFMQELLSLLIPLLGLNELYKNDMLFRQASEMLITVISMCVSFLLVGKAEKKRTHYEILPLGKPDSPLLAALAVPAGVALCLIGSYLTAYLTMFLEAIGLKLSSPDMAPPSSGFELVIYLMRLTIVAAVIEEISFRGVIMQPLRKYGNWFAIMMAAVIFGLAHCNLIQAPFAFVAGLAIGYFTIATNSLWTGILIHFFNNAISGVTSYIVESLDENTANIVSSAVVFTAIGIGLVCLALFFLRRGGVSVDNGANILTKGERVKAYCLNLPMILAFLAICWYTHFYISI